MIAKFSVKKPYTVIVGVILVVVLGVVSFTRMTTDLLPDMSLPYALIITTDVGASPEEIETDVTAPIEAAMATTSNIKSVSSSSYDNYSMVILEYEQNSNMDSVLIEIQQKLDQLAGSWPDSIGAPMIMQIDPDMMPVMVASVDIEGMDQGEISVYVENELVPSLESVEGIASVSTTGTLEENIQVTMDQEKIDALNEEIQSKIAEQFEEAQGELDDVAAQIESGKTELKKGQAELEEQIAAAENEIINGKIQAFVGESDLNMSLTLLTQVKGLLESAIPTLQSYYEQGMALQEQLDALALTQSPEQTEEILRLQAQIAQLEADIQKQLEQMNSDTQSEGTNTVPESGAAEDLLQQPIEGNGELAELQAQMALLTEQLENLQGVQGQNSAQAQELQAQLAEILNQLGSQNEQLAEYGINMQGIEDIPQAIAALTQTLAEVNTSIATMQEGQKQVSEGKLQLDDVLVTLNKSQIAGLLQMSEAAAKLADGESQLALGQAQIDEAKKSAEEAADLNNILTSEMLGNLLVAQNFAMPAGYVIEGDSQYMVRVGDKLSSMEELKNAVLIDMGLEGIEPIRLGDVAEVKMADNSAESYSKVDGNPAIMLSIEKQTGYSTGDVTKRAQEKFAALEQENEDLHMAVMMNQGVYIDVIVQSVLDNMILGAVLAVIVLIVFLKDLKPTMVIACSIPLSVIFAIVLMYFTDISLNIISLSGLALGIGMLVDNSIVVIENIYRLRGEGYSVRKAAVEGASQVTGAIIASTLTTVCVFAPIIFTEGITRQLFVDIALTIAYTLTASLVVALTFVPMMAAGVLKNTKEVKHELFDKILDVYAGVLEKSLRFKPLVFIVVIVLLVVSAVAAYSQGFTFMDMEMEADQLTVTVSAKEDEILEFEELTALSDEVVERISGIKGIETIGAMSGGGGTMMSMGGGSSDSVTMYLILEEDTQVSNQEIVAQVKELTKDMECQVNADASASDMTAMLGSGLTVQISGSDLDKLQELAKEVAEIVEAEEGTVDVQDGLDDTTPSFTIHVDKEKAARYGMTTAQVFQLVYVKTASAASPTTISTDLKDYAVYVKTAEQADVTLDDIRNITFTYTDRMGEEEEIALRDIVTFETGSALNTINRSSQTRYISVSAGIDAEHNVTLVSNSLMEKLEKIELPEGYAIAMTGEDEMINDAMNQLYLMLILAVIFIYLIMVAQFQSFLSPFIIMFTIPLAFTGGLFALYFTGNEISVVAMIGFVMLAGIIVNNGIVMVDYINQLRQEGMGKKDAIIESGTTRLRPILMTALTTILSMSTMALGLGEGSEMMQPMAIVTVGGLVYGTLLTLIVVPCIYDAFNREKSMVEEEL